MKVSFLSCLVIVTAPIHETTGFIFVRIQGGFHEIKNSVRTPHEKYRVTLLLLCTLSFLKQSHEIQKPLICDRYVMLL